MDHNDLPAYGDCVNIDIDISLIECVVARPGMYTLNGTFEETIAFLMGYYRGLHYSRYHVDKVEEWHHFNDWMACSGGDSWSWRTFRTVFATDKEALEGLAKMFEKFRGQKGVAAK